MNKKEFFLLIFTFSIASISSLLGECAVSV